MVDSNENTTMSDMFALLLRKTTTLARPSYALRGTTNHFSAAFDNDNNDITRLDILTRNRLCSDSRNLAITIRSHLGEFRLMSNGAANCRANKLNPDRASGVFAEQTRRRSEAAITPLTSTRRELE